MAEITDDELYDLSDEELETAYRDAKAGEVEMGVVDDDPGADDEEVVVEDEESEDEDVDVDADEEVEEDDDTEDEVDEDEDLEQPDDDEDSEDKDQDDEDDADDAEEPEDEPDGDETDNPDVEEEKSEKSDLTPVKRKYKANGQEFEFTEEEVLEQFGRVFGQAANYTQKMQAMADGRKTLSALKDNNLSHEDVNLMIDVMKGDKNAIAAVMKKAGLDAMDLDTEEESTYAPRDYGRSEQELAIDDVIGAIEQDQEFAVTQHVVDRQWDSGSRKALAENPQMIAGLHNDVKSGVYDKVSPMAMKLKVLDGGTKSDIEYYIEAGTQYYGELDAQEEAIAAKTKATAEAEALAAEEAKVERGKIDAVKQRKATNNVVKKAANKRKAAAPTKKAAGKKDVIDYLEDSDEAFDAWYKKLQDNM